MLQPGIEIAALQRRVEYLQGRLDEIETFLDRCCIPRDWDDPRIHGAKRLFSTLQRIQIFGSYVHHGDLKRAVELMADELLQEGR